MERKQPWKKGLLECASCSICLLGCCGPCVRKLCYDLIDRVLANNGLVLVHGKTIGLMEASSTRTGFAWCECMMFLGAQCLGAAWLYVSSSDLIRTTR